MKVVEFIGGLGNQLFCYAYYDFLKKNTRMKMFIHFILRVIMTIMA